MHSRLVCFTQLTRKIGPFVIDDRIFPEKPTKQHLKFTAEPFNEEEDLDTLWEPEGD